MSIFENFIGKQAKDVSPSAFGRWLNGTLLEAHKGHLTVSFEVKNEHTNPAGILHGGVIAGLIDEVIGMTTFTLEKPGFYVALNLNIDFLRPSSIGEILTAKSEVIRDGKNIAHAECKIFSKDNKLVAKATSNLMLTQR